MGKPAARVGDMTAHGGTITGPGCPTVLIGKMPAAQITNMHVCPMVTPATPPIPHVGGPIVGPVPPTVFIGKMPAACVGDMAICVGPPSTILPPGCLTVLIGQAGGGGGGGGSGSASDAASAATLTAASVSSVTGYNASGSQNQSTSQSQQQQQSQQPQQAQQQQQTQQQPAPFTLRDIVRILLDIESREGYEAARFFAGYLDYSVLTGMAMSGTDGNDPNQMPTRFMLLFGADDSQLQTVDQHPDRFNEQHPINVANLRKGLKLLGYTINDSGPYDRSVYAAHIRYIASAIQGPTEHAPTHTAKEGETLGSIAQLYGMPSWKYLYQYRQNRNKIGDNPDLLKPGTELDIPQWDSSSGKQMIRDKNEDPHQYTGGLVYRYPWVPYSVTIVDKNGDVYREKSNSEQPSSTFQKRKKYTITDAITGTELATGNISTADDIETLIPDAKKKRLRLTDEQ